MNCRSLFIILVIVMMGVTGCSGLAPFGDDTDAETTTAGTETTTTETETTTTGTQAPNEPTTTTQLSTPKEIDHPPGWDESGIDDFLEAYEQHYSALYSYDSFTPRRNGDTSNRAKRSPPSVGSTNPANSYTGTPPPPIREHRSSTRKNTRKTTRTTCRTGPEHPRTTARPELRSIRT